MAKRKQLLGLLEFNRGRADGRHGREMKPTTLSYAMGYARGMKEAKKRDRTEFGAGYRDGYEGRGIRPTSQQYVDGYKHGQALAEPRHPKPVPPPVDSRPLFLTFNRL